jgi:hypothetical protein
MNERDILAGVSGEPMHFPSTEVLRMVRAIVLLALQEAARYGVYRASFQGFRVQALRHSSVPGSDAFVEVNLRVSLGSAVVECGVVAMDIPQPPCAGLSARPRAATTDACTMEPRS